MNIHMYNVQFGDCFLMQDENENLIVDFGSDTPDVLPGVANRIMTECGDTETSILLTHFHKDHINGLLETEILKELNIKNVYLPDILAMRRLNTGLDFLQLEILREIFSSIVMFKKPIKITLYSFLERILEANAQITFLQRGNTFLFGKKNYQVLWPCFNTLRVDKRTEKSMISFLEKIKMIDKVEYIEAPNGEKICEKVKLGTIDLFIDALVDVYSTSKDEEQYESLKGRLQECYENMLRDMDEYRDVLVQHLKIAKERINSLWRQGNRISLVFQDESVNHKSNILMTGDVTDFDFKKIIEEKSGFQMSEKIEVIKAPHHATRSHFTELFPKCERILASNGEPLECHRRWGKISYQYGALYVSNKKSTIYCSNNRCELLELVGRNPCPTCCCANKPLINIIV